jgi:hypothetical protein
VMNASITALMIEAVRTIETSVYFNKTTRHYIPKGVIFYKLQFLYQHRIWKERINLVHFYLFFTLYREGGTPQSFHKINRTDNPHYDNPRINTWAGITMALK